MTRPDSGSPDSSANQDNAVWLDLVARLESPDPAEISGSPEAREGPGGAEPSDTHTGAASNATPRPFSDFDPLGLSAVVPVELSAEERQARGRLEGRAAAGRPQDAGGPRDYAGAADDPLMPDEFVPEEPPSLAGADPMTVLAWLGAVGGPVALVMSAMFWRSAPLLAILAMVAAFAASVVFLIMKLPGEKDEHDDGARI